MPDDVGKWRKYDTWITSKNISIENQKDKSIISINVRNKDNLSWNFIHLKHNKSAICQQWMNNKCEKNDHDAILETERKV